MIKTGYLVYHEVDCVFFLDENVIYIVPKKRGEITKLSKHFYDLNFPLEFSTPYLCTRAFIKESTYEDGRIKLKIKYMVGYFFGKSVSKMEIIGDAIDTFFNPAHFFYEKKHDDKKSIDYIYNCEIVDKWEIIFHGKPIVISLSFGNILNRGIASDLKFHPQLCLEFEETSDIDEIYSIYQVIMRFLKIVNYDVKCGKLKVNLYGKVEELHVQTVGDLYDYSGTQEQMTNVVYDVNYVRYKPYIGKLLQFVADNENYSFNHFPHDGLRFRGIHYSETDFVNIFSAFENECRANSELYEKVDASRTLNVKNNLLECIESISDNNLKDEERDFLSVARERIYQLGTQFGQKKKIQNAYSILHEILDDSIEKIFYRNEFKGKLSEKEINTISKYLADTRGKIAHGANIEIFSDEDEQYIKFLEILVYSMMLKRAGLENLDNEKVIGAVFGCNYKISE